MCIYEERAGAAWCRNATIEECAAACDRLTSGQEDVSPEFAMGVENGAMKCANAIRALKEEAPACIYEERNGAAWCRTHGFSCPKSEPEIISPSGD
jgi:hypothetical protein